MLRFYILNLFVFKVLVLFKYILCYGSTASVVCNIPIGVEFKYILCYGSTQGPGIIGGGVAI